MVESIPVRLTYVLRASQTLTLPTGTSARSSKEQLPISLMRYDDVLALMAVVGFLLHRSPAATTIRRV